MLTNYTMSSSYSRHARCISYAVATVIISMLGFAGNGLVIWIAGFKVKKSVVTTWYLSLAVSDFIFCSTLPFRVAYMVNKDWAFGRFMCKFNYFMMWLNMYSSIFLLVIISVDRCVLVMFPVWAQNKRTIRKASVTVILAWIIAATLSAPSAVFRDIRYDHYNQTTMCMYNYNNIEHHTANIACRFIFLFMVLFMIIIISYIFFIRKLKSNQTVKSKKPVKIMTVLIVTFLICWLPHQTLSLMLLFMPLRSLFTVYVYSLILSNANSCLNPFLYAFMGKTLRSNVTHFGQKLRMQSRRETIRTPSKGQIPQAVYPEQAPLPSLCTRLNFLKQEISCS